ncbi:TetR/AcrR family transcriptional regulator [Nocardia alba]|uniref:TetR family transcriptional regulator n=1 Tax=Nocardia alba TaxID=225051 RepID=A0A4R1FP58_9NOCA|nr:TetR family transcriptional regulator [Nocardia alba]TCJ96607.1 TetR family transcriptional regulator [Nocardia alba]
MVKDRAYAGVPAEQRRAQRRTTFLEAAREMIGTQGSTRLTVGGLCRQAGLTERYFYENFTTLDAVVTEVYDQVISELTDMIADRVRAAPAPLRDKVHAAIAAGVQAVADDPRVIRIAFTEAQFNPVLNTRRTATIRSFAALVLATVNKHLNPEMTGAVRAYGELAAMHLVGGLYETVYGWLNGALDLTREELVDESTEIFLVVLEQILGPDGLRRRQRGQLREDDPSESPTS